ncbi:MAG: hypothetical protein A2140_09610 [Candidatus Muproteobacteria bacterium RBG_16_62_13]|uniref:Uncharacterized protein n=1 Tax=Candidatus Muproteobacteria bacterium RBG_16_62_13 TaxID=1817756 RepID=A0A1F6T7E4_9PROT|nr:MAG: hypothetical protein A2140_09610 [Candidatus Muproteobacteria bacterium RBG_16_62_13]
MEMPVAAAVDITLRSERAVGGGAVKGIDPVAIDGDFFEGGGLQSFPERFALGQPVTDFDLGEFGGEGQAVLPAVVLAHLEQEHAQGVVAGEAGIGDVAVMPDGLDEFVESLHGGVVLGIYI